MNATANVFWEVKMQTTIFCLAPRCCVCVCARLCQRSFRLLLAFCWWNTRGSERMERENKKKTEKKVFVPLEFQANFQIRTRKSMFIVLKNVKNSLFSFVCRRTQMLMLETIPPFFSIAFDISQRKKEKKVHKTIQSLLQQEFSYFPFVFLFACRSQKEEEEERR